MSAPLVSVLLCNYNHGRFLKQCFQGLLCQTHQNIQIAITDDGSTDGSQEMIAEFAKADPRIEPNYFPQNRGVKAAFADSARRTRGKYLYSGAADDFVLNKNFFERAVEVLESDSRPAGYYGVTGVYIAETEKLNGAMGTAEVSGYNTPLQCCEGFLKYRSVVTGTSCVVRRELFMKHGGDQIEEMLEKMGPQADYCLFHDLAWRYGMYFEKTLVACMRVFQARSNYSANLDLWAYAARLCEMEKRLRAIGLSYPDMEKDWMHWRAANVIDSIKKSGIL